MEDAMDTSKDMTVTQEKSCRVKDLHHTSVADTEVAREHAQWWALG